jgi:site-specific recombinase XerD
MTAGGYSPRSIGNYVREMRFIFEYYPDTKPSAITADQVEKYICYIKQVFNSGHDKCRMVASSVSFFFKQILKRPYDLPSKLYPKKKFQLPNVMTADEVWQLLSNTGSIKQKAIVELFYSSGVRLEECSRIKLTDIDSKNMRIKVVRGKGNKDRYTLLSAHALTTLREYFGKHRPVTYLFEAKTKGKSVHCRTLQLQVELAMKQAGFKDKGYSAHTLRHSFATHLLGYGHRPAYDKRTAGP